MSSVVNDGVESRLVSVSLRRALSRAAKLMPLSLRRPTPSVTPFRLPSSEPSALVSSVAMAPAIWLMPAEEEVA
ncbi:hypothetical protein [Modicisalibacter luteus]|uniref:hypothetical protein n=1 Tax=Modicisalibacter luteus TaxID=453962 RepID=UPI00362DA449